MDPFVEQLRQPSVAHPTRSKWVFVPTHALGRTLGDRLVLEGTNWANVRFVTPLDIALRMVNSGAQLDYAFVSASLLPTLAASFVEQTKTALTFSDHYPVVLELADPATSK